MNMTETSNSKPPEPKRRRVSPKVRQALNARVHQGLTWKECAHLVGLSEAGIHKARNKSHVQQLYEEIKSQYIQHVEEMKAPHKARAFIVARDLMDNSKSDAVRARMVEFFAGESKNSPVNVAVQVNNHQPNRYEYARPDQEVVTIKSGPDKAD